MYKMMSAQEIAEYIVDHNSMRVDFTFDIMNDDGTCCTASGKPEGWHGIHKLNPFDTGTYTLAIGYYGGYTTQYYEKPYFNNKDAEARWIKKNISRYFHNSDEYDRENEKVCVEIA